MRTSQEFQTYRYRLLSAAVFWFACGFISPVLAADNIWTVQKLNEAKPWDRFVDSPISIKVEGRMGSSGGTLFRLLRCDANFIVDSAKLKLVPAKSTVEIRGKFKKDGVKVHFAVDDIKVMPGFVDQYEVKTSKLKRPTPAEWIELGEWAAERARFYEDDELAKKADEAYINSIEVEYKSLKPTDAEGRFLLAKKIDEYHLSSRRKMELVHEALRIQWQAALKAAPAIPDDWREFAASVSSQLPGTDVVLKVVPPDLKETYEQDPVSTYRNANDKLRTQLHRLFYVAITRKILLHDASSEGRDGDAIADDIDRLIPEEHALAEKQRGLRLAYRLAHINTATRSEVESLAKKFRERQQNEKAKQALTQWVKAHEFGLKGGGVVGLVQLADEYLTLLNDEPTAVEYLKDAYKIDPSFEEIKLKFAALGYQWQNGRWMKSGPSPHENSPSASPLPTVVAKDMTATNLRTLLGQPRSLARAITSRGITEVWSYGTPGTTNLVIRLEQKVRDNEPKVTVFSGQ